jgi:hydrogenase nickel incorporation protein HypA/HybF
MHELAITESLLDIAQKNAQQANATRVTDLHIVIGRLSSFVDDSVQFYWDILSENTICQGAKLHFTRLPARMVCLDCNNEFELPDQLEPCPKCGSAHVNVIQGDEFYLESIEVEQP